MAKSEVLDEMAHNIMSHLIWNYIVSLSRLDLACLLTQCLSFQKNVHFLTIQKSAKKQMTKFTSANFQKMLSLSHIILKIQRLEGKQCSSRGGSL